jgi:site-specific DNA recombinase
MRAAVYTRISLDKSGEGEGVERQRDECIELVAQRGWTHIATFDDRSISAADARKRRPGFEDLLAAIGRGEVDMVVALAFDRLSRNRRDEVRLIEVCGAAKVNLAFVKGPDMDLASAVGRGVGEVLAALARMEIEQKGERHRAALAQRARKGLPWGPIPAFGYGSDRVTVVEAEAALLREAYAAVLAGASCRGLAAQWNAAGVTSRTGKPWSGAAIKRVLINPRYMGVRATSIGTGTRRILREVGDAKWDKIVDEDVWRAVHAILTDPARTTTSTRVRVHLLPGIARCGVCGAPMRSYTHAHGWAAYSCSTSRHLVRKADPVDELVSEVVIARLSRDDVRDLLVDDERPDTVRLREKAAALRVRIANTRAAFVQDDTMTPADLREMLAGLQGRLAEVEATMASATRAPVLAELVAAADVRATWESLSLDRRRAVIATLLEVTILPGRRGPGFDPNTVAIDWT